MQIRSVLALMIALSAVLGQARAAMQVDSSRFAFADASVKAIDPSTRNHDGRQLTTARLVDRASLLQLIVSAYLDADSAGPCAVKLALGEECPAIAGSVPDWVRTDRFEVDARIDPEALPAEVIDRLRHFRFSSSPRRNIYPLPVQLMLQRLLEETFDLRVRRERREIPVWAITAPTKEVQGLTPTRSNGATIHGWARTTRKNMSPSVPNSPMEIVFESSTLKDAADFFSSYFDRPVLDRTGLVSNDEYEFTIEYLPDPRLPMRRGAERMFGLDIPRLNRGLEPLGFKIEPATTLFDVLVIERLQRPVVGNK